MRYIIYGAGAVGGVIGARLFEHGHDVVLIARGAHLDAIRERGLTLETPSGSRSLRIPVAGHPSELRFRPGDVLSRPCPTGSRQGDVLSRPCPTGSRQGDVLPQPCPTGPRQGEVLPRPCPTGPRQGDVLPGQGDVVILTTKTQDTERALDDLRIAAGPDIPVICAQNGVENERMALRRFAHVYAMLVILPATYLVPGVVQAHAYPVSGVLDAGCYPDGQDDLIERAAADLDASGFSSHAVARPMRLKYAKLLMNLGNALQAACGLDDAAGALHTRAREEALACYRAAGIDWAPDEEMDARRASMSRLGAIEGQARAGGSSWQSLARGAGSIESDYLNGEIALLGRLHGVPAPVNAALQIIGERMARDGMKPGSMTAAQVEDAIAREE